MVETISRSRVADETRTGRTAREVRLRRRVWDVTRSAAPKPRALARTFILLSLAGCSGDLSEAGGSDRAAGHADLNVGSALPLLSIGGLADSQVEFSRIAGALRLSDGRLVVADRDLRLIFFDPEGEPLGTVRMPENFRPTHIGSDFVVGVWRDDLDIESLQLWHLDREAMRIGPTDRGG